MYYNNAFPSIYDELITFYPVFYRDVFEMRAILEADGRVFDTAVENINAVIENSFVGSADEETITRLEAFLHLKTDKSRPLEERRRLVYSFFVGFGKLSASNLREIIRAFTGADSKITFVPTDADGNNTLFIEMDRGENDKLNYTDIETVLSKKIPAHIAYKAFVTYRFPTVIAKRQRHYKHEYRLCGLEPDIALLGKKQSKTAVTETDSAAVSYGSDYRYCGTSFAGTN